LWLLSFHVYVFTQAKFRVSLQAKIDVAMTGAIAIFVVLLCLRGPWRYALGLPFTIVVVWTVWAYFQV
jgi:hypothetical protein